MSSIHPRSLRRTASYPRLTSGAPASQAAAPALDLAAPRAAVTAARPAALPPTPPAPCPGAQILARFGQRDSSGVPRGMLDPIQHVPMTRPEQVGVIDEAAIFSDGPVTWPQHETYERDSLDEALRVQRDEHGEAAWTGDTFHPISPLSRRPFVMMRGQVLRHPDDALQVTIRHFLAQDPQVWEALTPAQQEAVCNAEVLLDMGRGDAVLSALRATPAEPTASGYFNAMCGESAKIRDAQAARRRQAREHASAADQGMSMGAASQGLYHGGFGADSGQRGSGVSVSPEETVDPAMHTTQWPRESGTAFTREVEFPRSRLFVAVPGMRRPRRVVWQWTARQP
jgi:hypothetical protein